MSVDLGMDPESKILYGNVGPAAGHIDRLARFATLIQMERKTIGGRCKVERVCGQRFGKSPKSPVSSQ